MPFTDDEERRFAYVATILPRHEMGTDRSLLKNQCQADHEARNPILASLLTRQ